MHIKFCPDIQVTVRFLLFACLAQSGEHNDGNKLNDRLYLKSARYINKKHKFKRAYEETVPMLAYSGLTVGRNKRVGRKPTCLIW